MVTARDIAEKLGFSVSTVGRALAGDKRISERTRHVVRKAAAELGYVGNLPARMMRGGSSNLVGLILPDIQNDFFASIAQALSESCDRRDYRIVLSITGDDAETEFRHIRDFVRARVAGIILVPSATLKAESVALLKRLPHVQLLRHMPGPDDLWFGIDDREVMERAAGHLLDLGHRHIAYIAASGQLSTGRRRLEGVRDSFRKRGIDDSPLIVLQKEPTTRWGEEAVRQVLTMKARPTAILSGSAHVTAGILSALRQAEIRLPQEMSLVGFGDPGWFEWWDPPITAVRPAVRSLAAECAHWFLERLQQREARQPQSGDAPGNESSHAISTSEFILRASTAPPAG